MHSGKHKASTLSFLLSFFTCTERQAGTYATEAINRQQKTLPRHTADWLAAPKHTEKKDSFRTNTQKTTSGFAPKMTTGN